MPRSPKPASQRVIRLAAPAGYTQRSCWPEARALGSLTSQRPAVVKATIPFVLPPARRLRLPWRRLNHDGGRSDATALARGRSRQRPGAHNRGCPDSEVSTRTPTAARLPLLCDRRSGAAYCPCHGARRSCVGRARVGVAPGVLLRVDLGSSAGCGGGAAFVEAGARFARVGLGDSGSRGVGTIGGGPFAWYGRASDLRGRGSASFGCGNGGGFGDARG